jgi:MinD superfamily P-loop ATPase
MKYAIASGKGGTGKTTVTASLASIWRHPVIAVDFDVEAPNLHLFLKPQIHGRETATMEIPRVDEARCNHCRRCAEICQFKAISVLGNVVLLFAEMCHGCGGCMAICPEGAITVDYRILGEIIWGGTEQFDFLMGRLRIAEAMSPPLIRAVKSKLDHMLKAGDGDVIIDSPPGVSCPAVNAVMDADVVALVTEPTPFGVYDLKLAHKAFAPLRKPMGVIVNRAGLGDSDLYHFCEAHDLPILTEIPFDRSIAEAYSNGQILAGYSPRYRDLFLDLADRIQSIGATVNGTREANVA